MGQFNGHHRTLGTTGSGKTTLNRVLAQGLYDRGVRVGVLSTVDLGDWRAHYRTDDVEAFIHWAQTRGRDNEPHALFVDEVRATLDPRDRRHSYLGTTIRHHGCLAFFMLHQSTDLPPVMRSSCPNLWCFNVNVESAVDLAREFNRPLLGRIAPELKRGEFLRCRPFEPLQRGRLVRKARGRWALEWVRITAQN